MAKQYNQKTKILWLKDILLEKTDLEHGISMEQILDTLNEEGVHAERKSIYNDISVLNEYGDSRYGYDFSIAKERRKNPYSGKTETVYYVEDRQFSEAEIRMLVDFVQTSRFITKKKSDELVEKLKSLTNEHYRQKVNRQVAVQGRVKALNENIYNYITIIQDAIAENKKITFDYCDWNFDKKMEKRANWKSIPVTPVGIVVDNMYYYLVAASYSKEKEKYISFHYRLDKMKNVDYADEFRIPEAVAAVDISKYEKTVFGMFGGMEEDVRLQVNDQFLGVVFDRFGSDISINRSGDGTFQTRVPVQLSDQFYSWVVALQGKVKILGPQKAVDGMQAMLEKAANCYGKTLTEVSKEE